MMASCSGDDAPICDDGYLTVGPSVCAWSLDVQAASASSWSWPASDGEFVIMGMRWILVAPNHTALEVEATLPFDSILLEINGTIYSMLAGSDRYGDASPVGFTACEVYRKSPGFECTAKCLDACACLSCDGSQAQANGQDGCAAVCSAWVHAGNVALGEGKTYKDEAEVAEVIMVERRGVAGLADSPPGCDASKCQKPVRRFEFRHPAGQFLKPFSVGTMAAVRQSSPWSQPSYAAPAAAPASLSATCGPRGGTVAVPCSKGGGQ